MSGSIDPSEELATPRAVRWMAALALVHLVAVAASIWTDVRRDSSNRVGILLRTYQSFAGTFRDYAFFAPSVASDIKAAFILEDEAGAKSTLVEFTANNREISLRYDCIIAGCMGDASARDLFAQSWAANLLGARPDVARVTVMAKRLELPSMAEYRAGQRPVWSILYAGTFGRRGNPSSR